MNKISSHIVNGLKIAVPFIIIFSISYALHTNWILPKWISDYALWMVVPVLSAFIAHSIVNKFLLIPGFLLGVYANTTDIGFFGGIIGGLLIGYLGLLLVRHIKQTGNKHYMILGYLGVGIVSLGISYVAMRFLIAPPIRFFLDVVEDYVGQIGTSQTFLLVGVLAVLTSIDLGGPFNKIAFGFSLEFYLNQLYHITGPVLVSVAIPPIAIYLALKLYPNRFNKADHTSSKLALIGGIFAMTEGAIPVAYRRPHVLIPIIVFGCLLGSLFAVYTGLENILLVGGLLGIVSSNNILWYILSHTIGVGCIILLIPVVLKKQLIEPSTRV